MRNVFLLHGRPEKPRIVPVALVKGLLDARELARDESEPGVYNVDDDPVCAVVAPIRVKAGGEVVVHAAFVDASQVVLFGCGARGEDLFERVESEVIDADVDFPVAGHVVAPHGGAERISGFVADADDAVLCLDESGWLVDGVFLSDRIFGITTGARWAADPYFLGQ